LSLKLAIIQLFLVTVTIKVEYNSTYFVTNLNYIYHFDIISL